MQSHLLTILILLPVVGAATAVVYSLTPGAKESHHRWIALGFTTVVFILSLLLIAGCVGLLLLVASANASTLLLARASNRRHELAVRTALGATRGRLLSLAVAESLVFACLGGLAGLFLGGWALRAVLPLFAGSLPAAIPIDIDARAAVFTAAISAVLGLSFGVVVALHRPGGGLVDALKASGRSISASARASGPSCAVMTVSPRSERSSVMRTMRRRSGSSSTTRAL